MTAHSHLGASGAERWLSCPGSTTLIQTFGTPAEDGDGPDYRWQGSVAHAGIADCLINGCEAWETVGREYEGHIMTPELAEGVAFYLSVVLPDISDATGVMVEAKLAEPDIHPALFGTVDLGYLKTTTLCIDDYKNGAGVSVDVTENPQEMYYAFLLLKRLQRESPMVAAGITAVRLRIIQPNDFNPAGKVRVWDTTPDFILNWAETVLVPAMQRADKETGLMVGDHCRFCPAKLVCPAMKGLFKAVAEADIADAKTMSDEDLARAYLLIEPAKMMAKALAEEVFARLMSGTSLSTAKLVRKKADRVWKPEALERFSTLFGTKAFTEPKFKSPAQMEELPMAGPIVKELAYKPEAGLTVEPMSGKGIAVKPPKASVLLGQFHLEGE